MLVGGFKRRMLNKRETTAVASANAAMAGKEPRSCQTADINSSAIEIMADAANQAVTGWLRTTLKPHPIIMTATANVARFSHRPQSSIRIASIPQASPLAETTLAISCFPVTRRPWPRPQQREIVLDVPIVGDAAVLDLEEVSGDEGDGLAVALDPAEGAGEMAGEAHVHGDVIAGEDHLFYRHREVGNCGAELARGEGRPLRSLRAARRQGTIGEGRRDGLFQEGFITAVPEFVERADRLQGRVALRVGNRCGDDEVIDPDVVGSESRDAKRHRQGEWQGAEGAQDRGLIRHRSVPVQVVGPGKPVTFGAPRSMTGVAARLASA